MQYSAGSSGFARRWDVANGRARRPTTARWTGCCAEHDLLRARRRRLREVLVCTAAGTYVAVRLPAPPRYPQRLSAMQLIAARARRARPRPARSAATWPRANALLVICDADAAIAGVPGLLFKERGPRFFEDDGRGRTTSRLPK